MTRNKKIFLYTVIIGLLTHAFRLTNVMVNADTTNYLNSIEPRWVIYLGRYLLPLVEKIRGNYELPFFIGLISIFLIGFTAVVIAEIFDLKRPIALLLTAWILVANPVVTSMFTYMYTADGYMISLLFATLAVYFSVKKEGFRGIVFGGLCLFVSLGFYQAFITTTILLMVLWLLLLLLNPGEKMKSVWKTMGRFLTTGIFGLVLYGIILKIVWSAYGFGTTEYMGMNGQSTGIVKHMLEATVDCYIDFARYFIVRFQFNCYNIMNVMLFLFMAVIVFVLLAKKKLWKQPVRWICIVLLFLMLPLLGFAFEFASEEVAYTSTSMEYGIVVIYLYPLIMMENLDCGSGRFGEWLNKNYRRRHPLWILLCILLLCISFHFSVIAHQAYRSVDNANTKIEFLLNRLQARMEIQEGYHNDMEVAIIGSTFEKPEYVYAAPMMSGVVSNMFLSVPREYILLLNWYTSTHYTESSEARIAELMETEEFGEMEVWPSEHAVKIIDGTMVLYLSE